MPNPKLLLKLRDLHEELLAIHDDVRTLASLDEATVERLGQLVTDACDLVDQADRPVNDSSASATRKTLLATMAELEAAQSANPRIQQFLAQISEIVSELPR